MKAFHGHTKLIIDIVKYQIFLFLAFSGTYKNYGWAKFDNIFTLTFNVLCKYKKFNVMLRFCKKFVNACA